MHNQQNRIDKNTSDVSQGQSGEESSAHIANNIVLVDTTTEAAIEIDGGNGVLAVDSASGSQIDDKNGINDATDVLLADTSNEAPKEAHTVSDDNSTAEPGNEGQSDVHDVIDADIVHIDREFALNYRYKLIEVRICLISRMACSFDDFYLVFFFILSRAASNANILMSMSFFTPKKSTI